MGSLVSYLYEICLGLAIAASAIFALLLFRCAGFNLCHIELAVKKKWQNLPRTIVKLLSALHILALVLPLALILWLTHQLSAHGLYKRWNLSASAGLMLSTVYVAALGFLSWKHALWHRTWFENVCICLCTAGFVAFIAIRDGNYNYETHTTIYFVSSLVLMVVFVYSLTVETSIDLTQLYSQFLEYYEKKAKTVIVKEEVKEEVNSASMQESKEECKLEGSQGEKNEERVPEINLINLSLIASRVSVESGERSHVVRAPQAFPEAQRRADTQTRELVQADPNYKQEFREILEATKEASKSGKKVRTVSLILLGIIYLIYNIVHFVKNIETKYVRIGFVQTFFLIYFDILILLWSRSKLRRPVSPVIETSLLMLVSRVCLSVSFRYWIYLHCVVYLVLATVIGTSICEYYCSTAPSPKYEQYKDLSLVEKLLNRFEFHYAMLLAAIGMSGGLSFSEMIMRSLNFSLKEGRMLSLVCICTEIYAVNFILFQFAARLYRRKDSRLTGITLALFIIAWGLGIATGFVCEANASFVVTPQIVYIICFFSSPIIGLALVILSHWIRNDYCYYENPNSSKGFLSGMIPRTTQDFKILMAILATAVVLSVYALLLHYTGAHDFYPYMISFSIAIAWSTITCTVKFVHTFYKFDKFIVFQVSIAVVLMVVFVVLACMHSKEHGSAMSYVVITMACWYVAALCTLLSFYIFFDLNFELTPTSLSLIGVMSFMIEAWSVFSFTFDYNYKFLLYPNIIILKVWYVVFLYTQWRRHNYSLPHCYAVINIFLIVLTFCVILAFSITLSDSVRVDLIIYEILLELLLVYGLRFVKFLRQGRKENHQQRISTIGIFPVFRLDIENFQMVQANSMPLFTLMNLLIVIVWSMFISLISVRKCSLEILAMCMAFALGVIYLAELAFRSKWVEDISELESLNAKDLYTCLRQTVLSSMLGIIPSSNGGDVDIESLVVFLNKLFDQNENIEAWETLRKMQCRELGSWFNFCDAGSLNLNEINDGQLLRAAMNIARLNEELEENPPDYFTQLSNLQLIDKTIQERCFMKAKRFASFIAQLRLIMKAKKLKSNEKYVKKQMHHVATADTTYTKLNCIPCNVIYEAGTHIELDLIGASIFMPWKWVRAKEIHPKSATIHIFPKAFTFDYK